MSTLIYSDICGFNSLSKGWSKKYSRKLWKFDYGTYWSKCGVIL